MPFYYLCPIRVLLSFFLLGCLTLGFCFFLLNNCVSRLLYLINDDLHNGGGGIGERTSVIQLWSVSLPRAHTMALSSFNLKQAFSREKPHVSVRILPDNKTVQRNVHIVVSHRLGRDNDRSTDRRGILRRVMTMSSALPGISMLTNLISVFELVDAINLQASG